MIRVGTRATSHYAARVVRFIRAWRRIHFRITPGCKLLVTNLAEYRTIVLYVLVLYSRTAPFDKSNKSY